MSEYRWNMAGQGICRMGVRKGRLSAWLVVRIKTANKLHIIKNQVVILRKIRGIQEKLQRKDRDAAFHQRQRRHLLQQR